MANPCSLFWSLRFLCHLCHFFGCCCLSSWSFHYRVEELWKELKIPEADRDFYSNVLFSSPSSLEIASRIQILVCAFFCVCLYLSISISRIRVCMKYFGLICSFPDWALKTSNRIKSIMWFSLTVLQFFFMCMIIFDSISNLSSIDRSCWSCFEWLISEKCFFMTWDIYSSLFLTWKSVLWTPPFVFFIFRLRISFSISLMAGSPSPLYIFRGGKIRSYSLELIIFLYCIHLYLLLFSLFFLYLFSVLFFLVG